MRNKKIKTFLVLALCCVAVVSCSNEDVLQDSASTPSSLDGIWQSSKPDIVTVIDGESITATISTEDSESCASGVIFYDSASDVFRVQFEQFDPTSSPVVSELVIFQVLKGSGLKGESGADKSTDDVAFNTSNSLFVAVASMSDGTQDTCVFQQLCALQSQQNYLPAMFGAKGVRELLCNNGKVVKTDRWMSELPDETLLRRLAIPGTHDAATSSILLPVLGKDQMYDLEEQLDMGVRYFDLRVDDCGRITHGGVRTQYTFTSALDCLSRWQEKHSGEGVLMEIRWEKDKVAYTAYEILVKAEIAATEAYNSSMARLFPLLKKDVPCLEEAMDEWQKKSKAAYSVEASSVIKKYADRIVAINNNLTLGDLRGKMCIYDCDDNSIVDVSDRTEKGDYPDSQAMESSEALQERIAGVVRSMEDFATTNPDDEFFCRICVSGYVCPWATEGQIPFSKAMAPYIIDKSGELVTSNKTSCAIFLMDYAPLQIDDRSAFCENLVKMNFPGKL